MGPVSRPYAAAAGAARVIVWMCLGSRAAEREKPVTAAHDSSWDSGTRLRVLLVEDDDGDALLVEEMLADTSVPFSLERVATLAAALAGPLTADCVLLDLQLPDAMGLSGLTRLGQHAPGVAIV